MTDDSTERYAELRRRLSQATQKVCPQWSWDLRDELVQRCLVRLMEIDRRSEGNRDLSASYLWRVAHSVVVDEVRKVRRRQEVPLGDEHQESVAAPTSDDPERYAASREIGRGIRACLAELGRPRRLAVALYLEGHTVPESARLLGWTPKQTENLTYRGLTRLRECLAGKGFKL